MKLGATKRLLTIHAVVLCVGLALSTLIYLHGQAIVEGTALLYEQDVPKLERLTNFKLAIVEQQPTLYEYYVTMDRSTFKRREAANNKIIEEGLRVFRRTFPHRKELLEIKDEYGRIRQLGVKLDDVMKAPDVEWDQARSLLAATQPLTTDINKRVDGLVSTMRHEVARRARETNDRIERITEIVALFSATLFLVVLVAGYYLNAYLAEGAERRRLALFPERNPNPILSLGLDGTVIYANASAQKLMNAVGSEETGLFPPDLADRLDRLRGSTAESVHWEHPVRGRILDCSIHLLEDLNVAHAYLTDITERKRAERSLKESEERFRQVAEMTGEWIWEQNPAGFYIYSNAALKNILGYEPEELVGTHYYELLTPEDRKHWSTEMSADDEKKSFFHLTNHYRHKDGHEVFTEYTGEPILDDTGRIVKWRGVDRDLTQRMQAEEAARRAEVKLAGVRKEMTIAHEIQESLFPGEPLLLPNVRIAGYCLPAAQVGGDYFDYFRRGEDRIDVVIADVSGHSVGAALFMVATRATLRSPTHQEGSAAEILACLNGSLHEDLDHAGFFITMFYMQYNPVTGQLNYANAGHMPPFLFHERDLACSTLDTDGLILGVETQVQFEERTLSLNSGDIVFLYTDGIVEADNADSEFYGTERLAEVLARCRHLEPEALIDQVMEDLRSFCKRDCFTDDVTMVVMKVT
jgi:PAS domain S-box-containing protein